jgi:putative transposase
VHAYVLLTTHVHLLVTPETPDGLAKLMQSVGRRYVQYVNRFYKRSGSLWEGRFKSNLVQTEDYFFTLSALHRTLSC